MRFLLDEDLPASLIRALREMGHDVLSVKELLRGERDEVVLSRAQDDRRVVVTLDKGFGEITFRSRLPASCGIVLFRLEGSDPDEDVHRYPRSSIGLGRPFHGRDGDGHEEAPTA